jgi:hypothetical protein
MGSGASAIRKWQGRWIKAQQDRTSRAFFEAFCDSLHAQEDPQSDGPPGQLIAMDRSYCVTYGIIWNGDRYLLGLPVDNAVRYDGVDWRNRLLDRYDGATLSALPGAKRHARPKSLPP